MFLYKEIADITNSTDINNKHFKLNCPLVTLSKFHIFHLRNFRNLMQYLQTHWPTVKYQKKWFSCFSARNSWQRKWTSIFLISWPLQHTPLESEVNSYNRNLPITNWSIFKTHERSWSVCGIGRFTSASEEPICTRWLKKIYHSISGHYL